MVKKTMKSDAQKTAKMNQIRKDCARVGLSVKDADKLMDKYGIDCAYTIVRESLQAPAHVTANMNITYRNSKNTIKYFVTNNVNDATVAKGIKRTADYVKDSKKNSRYTSAEATVGGSTVQRNRTNAQNSANRVDTRVNTNHAQNTQSKSQQNTPNRPPYKMDNVPVLPTIEVPKLEVPNSVTLSFKPKTVDEQVADEMARLKKEHPNGVTIGDLKAEGMTAGLNSKVITGDNLKYLHAGKDGKGMGNAVKEATKTVKDKYGCGEAVRKGLTSYMNKTYQSGLPTNEAEFYGKTTGGTSAAATLYKAFDEEHFTVLTYQQGNNAFLNNVPDGTTVFFDKPKGRTLTNKNGQSFPHPGHTATYNKTDGCWYAGGYCQTKDKISKGYNTYGNYTKIAITNDCTVDDVLLERMVREQVEQNNRAAATRTNNNRKNKGR